MSSPSINSVSSTGYGFGNGPAGTRSLPRESAQGPAHIPNDGDVENDMDRLIKAGKNRELQDSDVQPLLSDVINQLTPKGQALYVGAVENKQVRSPQDVARLKAMIQRNTLNPHGMGPVSLMIALKMAQEASAPAAAAGVTHESPAGAVVAGATSVQPGQPQG